MTDSTFPSNLLINSEISVISSVLSNRSLTSWYSGVPSTIDLPQIHSSLFIRNSRKPLRYCAGIKPSSLSSSPFFSISFKIEYPKILEKSSNKAFLYAISVSLVSLVILSCFFIKSFFSSNNSNGSLSPKAFHLSFNSLILLLYFFTALLSFSISSEYLFTSSS